MTLFAKRWWFAVLLAVAPAAQGSISFNTTYGSTMQADPNFSTIQQTINSALAVYSSQISTNITVALNFDEMASGLGQSSTYFGVITYSQLQAALAAHATSLDDSTALANLPIGATNPVNGGTNVDVMIANMRALGFSANPPSGQPDSFIKLNTSLMNLSRASIDPNKYDLFAVVSHEVDEALGLGSGVGHTNIRVEDLYRYDQNGVRSFTNSTSAQAFFSLNGTTQLAEFNQSGTGDYGDWASSATPKVQDAFATPGATPNLGVELRALDVIGYDLAVPEPASWSILGLGLAALWARRRAKTME